MSDAQSILAQMTKAVEEGDEVLAASASEAAVAAGIDPQEAILEGLVPGMVELGRQYEVGECYVPELIVAAEALYAGAGRPSAAGHRIRLRASAAAGSSSSAPCRATCTTSARTW